MALSDAGGTGTSLAGRAAQMRREVLRMDLGESYGVNVAQEAARDRAGER